jgi:hypothetical protein
MYAMKMHNFKTEFEFHAKLLQAMRDDPVINRRIMHLLKMDSYSRRFVLNNWLEQLRRNNAPPKLIQSLGCLFDDSIAKRVLTIINDPPIINTNID